MPELPEVETIRRELRRVMVGATIRVVKISLPKIVKHPPGVFQRAVIGSCVSDIQRRAKLVLIELDSGWTVIIHLKMSGQLIWRANSGTLKVGGHPIPGGTEYLPNKYSHVVFVTDRGTLFFNDQRQFGFVKLVKSLDMPRWLESQGYGPEPLEKAFTFDVFSSILKRHAKKRLKPTLMDQTVLAGVGNIYADEACFAARVRPTRRIMTLTARERRDLYRGLVAILRLAIRKKGTTADAYRTASGQPGKMMGFLKAYQRTGRRCRRCPGIIVKMTLANRGTHYCPRCQR